MEQADDDIDILIDFYNDVHGEKWPIDKQWSNSEHPSQWKGVRLESNRVTGLSINNCITGFKNVINIFYTSYAMC